RDPRDPLTVTLNPDSRFSSVKRGVSMRPVLVGLFAIASVSAWAQERTFDITPWWQLGTGGPIKAINTTIRVVDNPTRRLIESNGEFEVTISPELIAAQGSEPFPPGGKFRVFYEFKLEFKPNDDASAWGFWATMNARMSPEVGVPLLQAFGKLAESRDPANADLGLTASETQFLMRMFERAKSLRNLSSRDTRLVLEMLQELTDKILENFNDPSFLALAKQEYPVDALRRAVGFYRLGFTKLLAGRVQDRNHDSYVAEIPGVNETERFLVELEGVDGVFAQHKPAFPGVFPAAQLDPIFAFLMSGDEPFGLTALFTKPPPSCITGVAGGGEETSEN
ncbi:hypothetical protein K2X33_06855, partial [bacterium]|nr:hypothetical protein [bacterium]